MAPHGEAIACNNYRRKSGSNFCRPPPLSNTSLHRTFSDITFDLFSKEAPKINEISSKDLPAISEVEKVKCACCGMNEECTPEYIDRVRENFMGKWLCGLCTEAVKEEMMKNGGKSKEEALNTHMNACFRFNKLGRSYPALFQADAMREILRKRAKSLSPKASVVQKTGGISRSTSCMPAITRGVKNLSVAN